MMNMTLLEKERYMRLNVGLPKMFWAEAMDMTCYIINRLPHVVLEGKTREEMWLGNQLTILI